MSWKALTEHKETNEKGMYIGTSIEQIEKLVKVVGHKIVKVFSITNNIETEVIYEGR